MLKWLIGKLMLSATRAEKAACESVFAPALLSTYKQ